jgi:hypothetical protein
MRSGERMRKARALLRAGGVVTFAVGLVCLPVGFGVNPKRDLSLFYNLADLGVFLTIGLILVAAGLVMAILSCLLRGERE